MARQSDGILPAAGRAPLAIYDRAVALGGREGAFRSSLLALCSGGVLDVGAGTGTLAIALARRGASVVAVEPDAAALKIAQGKKGAGAVDWRSGRADALPVDDVAFDRVVLSLVLHHLPDSGKESALAECRRVLRPSGRVVLADFTTPGDPLMALAFRGLQLADGRETTALMGRGGLPSLLRDAGFTNVTEHRRLRTAFGRVAITSAAP